MAGGVTEALDDWPAPPVLRDLAMVTAPWEVLRAYAETRFLADVLHGDTELYLGPGPKLRSTWDRAVKLQRRLELMRTTYPSSFVEGGAVRDDPITRESVGDAVSVAGVFTAQMSEEIVSTHGLNAPPEAQLTITVAALREVIDTINVLRAAAQRLLDTDQVMGRVTPGASVIEPGWLEGVDRRTAMPPTIKGPGYQGPGFDALASEVQRRDAKEDLKARLHRPGNGAVWVLANGYDQFRAWCQDQAINHLNTSLVAFASQGLWQTWLQGVERPHYALGHGWEDRPDRGEFLDFMRERGGTEWSPTR